VSHFMAANNCQERDAPRSGNVPVNRRS